MDLSPEDIKGFFNLPKEKFSRCIHESFQCKNEPIKAHSIQNAKVLDLLQADGHVIMPVPKLSADKPPEAQFKKVGRNDASTFTGLCSEHDNALFKAVDTEPLDVSNDAHKQQLSHRAILRELHTLLEGAGRMQAVVDDLVKRGKIASDRPGPAMSTAAAAFEKPWRLFRFLNRHYTPPDGSHSALEHQVLEFDRQRPVVAVSTVFSVGRDRGGDMVGTTFTVIPVSETKTVAIFTYPTAQKDAIWKVLGPIFDAKDDHTRKCEISKLIIQRIENFALSPVHFDGWSPEKQKRIIDEFNRSILGPVKLEDHPDLMLF